MKAIILTDERATLLETALYDAWRAAEGQAGIIVKDGGAHERRANDIYALYEFVRHGDGERIPKTAFTEGGWSFRPSATVERGQLTGEKTFHVFRPRDRSYVHGSIAQNGPVWIVSRTGNRQRAFLSFAEAKGHMLNLLPKDRVT